MFDSKKIAEALLNTGAFRVSLDPLFTWTSGIKSPVYCDLRSLNSDVETRRLITEAFASLLDLKEVDVVAGTSTAGITWAAWLAEALSKPMVYVRSSSKEHGTKRRVEGVVQPGQRVVVVEDLISTGGSSADTVRALREDCDAVVTQVLAINTYEMPQAEAAFKTLGVQLNTLTSFSEIVSVAQSNKAITQEQVSQLQDFSKDPSGWAGRHGLD